MVQDALDQALVETLDADACSRLGPICPIGPALALEIIDDGMARSLPKWRDRLMGYGLTIFQMPTPGDLLGVARTLIRYADTGDDQRSLVVDALRDALSSNHTRECAATLQQTMSRIMDETRVRQATKGIAAVKPHPSASDVSTATPMPPDWSNFDDELATANLTGDGATLAASAVAALHRINNAGEVTDEDAQAVLATLVDDAVAQVLCTALSYIAEAHPTLVAQLRERVLPYVYRAAVGDALR